MIKFKMMQRLQLYDCGELAYNYDYEKQENFAKVYME